MHAESYRKTYRSIDADDSNYLVRVRPDRHEKGVPVYEETHGNSHNPVPYI